MTGPIVQTKLFVPRRRGATVPRPRLSDRLSRGIDARLTLVSAPAGFGKTTLLAAWLASAPRPEGLTAWLSLDQSDNDPTTFWTYVIAAAQTVAPAMGTGSLALIDAAQTSPEPVLGALLNELNALPNDLVLVLDDYHVIDDRRVHDAAAVRDPPGNILRNCPASQRSLIGRNSKSMRSRPETGTVTATASRGW